MQSQLSLDFGDAPLVFGTNLAVMAGAGAGKTHGLVSLCLQLLAGARSEGAPLPPSRLFMLTFTEKAAAEMRDRLRHRVDRLARGDSREDERMLRSALGRKTLPAAPFWRAVRENLSAATVGTFHSLCAQLLRESTSSHGMETMFQILEERDAEDLLQSTAERLVLESLEQKQPGVQELCRSLDFASGRFSLGLVDSLCAMLRQLRDEGLPPAGVPISNRDECRTQFQDGLARLNAAISAAAALEWSEPRRELLRVLGRALDGMSLENFLKPARFPLLQRTLKSLPAKGEVWGAVNRELFGSGSANFGLVDLYAAHAVIASEEAFRGLVSDLEGRYRSELHRRGVVDFSELLIRARDVLRSDRAAREGVQARVGALLVDEFQDTNLLQLELVTLLAEKRDGAPRALTAESAVRDLPLEPGLLCVVGDRKQSIYDFRGADVSVFGWLANKIERGGGKRVFLRQNRRSSPTLLSFFNGAFSRLMQPLPDAREYEVRYQPEDEQLAVRASKDPERCIDWVVFEPEDTAEACRAKEAEAIARHLAGMLAAGAPAFVESSEGAVRPPRGSDIAILFRRFTFLDVYRQALTRWAIPHRVIRGRGFYGAQEVMDLASLLFLVANPGNSVAFAAVLRSPWVALSDASLFRLAAICGGRLSLRGVPNDEKLAESGLPQGELDRLRRFLHLHHRLQREQDRLGVRVLLRVALEETGFRVVLAGTPFGEQALSNVDRALELAGRWDASGRGDSQALGDYLLALTDAEPFEAQPDVDVEDARSVQLLTIHQAKGLEWPVVLIPDLAAQRIRGQGRIAFDRRLGLAMKPRLPDDFENRRSPRVQQIAAERSRREDAEYLRLLYVAMTRAKDRLILSGQNERCRGTWRDLLKKVVDSEPSLSAAISEVNPNSPPLPLVEGLPLPRAAREEASLTPHKAAREEASLTPHKGEGKEVVLPVTHLQDYFLCPRRYFYARQLRLSEFPLVFELDAKDEEESGGRTAADPRTRGTVAHRLLERVDLGLIGRPALADHLKDLLWSEGWDPSDTSASELVQWVLNFLRTPFAAKMAANPNRVHRELPFLLRLGGAEGELAVHLKGQIDLLVEEEDGSATVVDYKASMRHPQGLAPYAFQLDCYALAARRLVKPDVPLRTAIAFLREAKPEPESRPLHTGDATRLSDEVIRAARELLSASPGREWSGLPKPQCEAIHCGYQYRCHAHPTGL